MRFIAVGVVYASTPNNYE